MSNAMQFESDFHTWTMDKFKDGKLDQEDLNQLFTPEDELELGGENQNIHFQKMIINIALSGTPPVWPGVLSLLIGLLGFLCNIFDQDYKVESEPPKDTVPPISL